MKTNQTAPRPATKASGSAALSKYKKNLRLYKYYKMKKEIGILFTSGDEVKLKKYKARSEKARKLAAPELIKGLRKKKAAKGRGKKRGGVGGNLSKLK